MPEVWILFTFRKAGALSALEYFKPYRYLRLHEDLLVFHSFFPFNHELYLSFKNFVTSILPMLFDLFNLYLKLGRFGTSFRLI